jgi:hypothetical protein
MDLAYKSSSAMATSLQKYNESISSKKTKLQNPEESQDLDEEFLTREKQANVLHLRRQASFTFLFLARSRSVCLSLSPARTLSPALSLSRGALLLSRSVCRPQILRRASKELPAFLEELPTTPLPNLLITTLDSSAIYPLLLLYLFQRFLLAPNFANVGNFFEAATHSMTLFFFFL